MLTFERLRRYWYFFALGVLVLGTLVSAWTWQFILAAQSSTSHGQSNQVMGGQAIGSQVRNRPSPQQLVQGNSLRIPAIGLNAPIEAVGTMPNGSMGVPTARPWDGVGWYEYGPYPGESGSAVIDGHLDRPGGSPAVFWNLRKLRPGDSVMIFAQGAPTRHFRVIKVVVYQSNAPTRAIFAPNGSKYLNLITCAGQWVPEKHQTTERLVVYTALV